MFRQGSGILYNVCYELLKVFCVLGRNHRLTGFNFKSPPGNPCHLAATTCYVLIFRKALWI